MANKFYTVTQLNETTAVEDDDLFHIVEDLGAGSYQSRRVTAANLKSYVNNVPSTIPTLSKVSVSRSTSYYLLSDGRLFGAGGALNGTLGLGPAVTSIAPPSLIPIFNPSIVAVDVSGGTDSVGVVDSDGNLWTSGFNNSGELGRSGGGGDDESTYFQKVSISGNPTITNVHCGHSVSYAIDDNGNLYACGLNDYGQLGVGDTTNRSVFTQVTLPGGITCVDIKSSMNSTIILGSDGNLYSAGYNANGQLGITGDTTNRSSFTLVTSKPVGIVEKIVPGYYSFGILMDDGKVYTSGYNAYDFWGIGSSSDNLGFTQITAVGSDNIDISGIAFYYGPEVYTSLSVLKSSGIIYSCGLNSGGYVGDKTTIDRTSYVLTDLSILKSGDSISQLIDTGGPGKFVIDSNGKLLCWGLNDYGLLGITQDVYWLTRPVYHPINNIIFG